MRRFKTQYMVHKKMCPDIGWAARYPTPPAGRGWRLVSVAIAEAQSAFYFYWERRVRRAMKLPKNEFPVEK